MTGCPVQPFPHHVEVTPRSVELEHIGVSGYLQMTLGVSGMGPVPYQVFVGFPLNIRSPSTALPQGLPTDRASTQRWRGSSGIVVDEVEGAVADVLPMRVVPVVGVDSLVVGTSMSSTDVVSEASVDPGVPSPEVNTKNKPMLVVARRTPRIAPTITGRRGSGDIGKGVYGTLSGSRGIVSLGSTVNRVRPNLKAVRGLGRGLRGQVRDSGLSINAAAVAYNAFLALVPLGAALLGVAAIIGQDQDALAGVEVALEPIVPDSVKVFIVDLLRESGARVEGSEWWLITGSVLAALLLGSRAVVALQKALAEVEQETERRPVVQMRLVAIGLTVGGGASLLGTSVLLVGGRRIVEFVAEWSGLSAIADVWVWMRIPLAGSGLFAFLLAFYHYGPPRPLPRSWVAAVVASVGVVLASLAFGGYLALAPELGPTFGTLGAVAVALVWLYMGAMAILLGAVVVAYTDRWSAT